MVKKKKAPKTDRWWLKGIGDVYSGRKRLRNAQIAQLSRIYKEEQRPLSKTGC